MECAFDAQNLISISLRKIQSSRTQRGGIKLHKNLLVTYVLRNARQLYMSKNLSQAQRTHHYEEVSAAHDGHEYLELSGSLTELADDLYRNFAGVESDTWHCGAHQPLGQPAAAAAAAAVGSVVAAHEEEEEEEEEEEVEVGGVVVVAHRDRHRHRDQDQDASACAMLSPSDSDALMVSEACWSCADKSSWELPMTSAQANQKTVLDLDTHVVTTVTNGYYFHSDWCAQPRQQGAQQQGAQCYGKKRKLDTSYHVVEPEFYLPDFGPAAAVAPCKRMRSDDEALSDSEHLDCANISNLISVLGSGGLSDFVSWQHTDLEQIFAAQTICLKHTLLSGSGWTRAIEAF